MGMLISHTGTFEACGGMEPLGFIRSEDKSGAEQHVAARN
jgi:hypothetical protein